MKNYKLKLLSKRLKSGKCQIKFFVTASSSPEMYGYLLTEAGSTLKEVVSIIEKRVKSRESKDGFYHSQLYNLAQREKPEDDILIFNN